LSLRLGVALLSVAATGFISAQEEHDATLAKAKAAFAKADRELNQAWDAAKAAVSSTALPALTLRQRQFLESRDQRARFESEQAGEKGGTKGRVYLSTAADMMAARAEWLRARARPAENSLTGEWSDGYGGTLQIVQQDGRLLFTFDVVRGRAAHTGGIAGVSSWNSNLGWFSDKGRDPAKTDETNIAFIEREGEIEVVGANTSYYHGMRAFFDGFYCKSGPLDEKEQAALIKAAESGVVADP
jgi:uncharacterized protein YecT (DUF1311 family)